MQIAVVGGSHSRRVIEDAVTLRGFIRNHAEILMVPMPEPVLVPEVTEEEMEGLVALLMMRRQASVSPEEGADALEAHYEQLLNESPFEEEMRSYERFASPPRSSCGHLPSLAACEKECEMKDLAGSAAPLGRTQPLTTLFSARSRRV